MVYRKRRLPVIAAGLRLLKLSPGTRRRAHPADPASPCLPRTPRRTRIRPVVIPAKRAVHEKPMKYPMKYPMKNLVTKSPAPGILCCLCAAAVAIASGSSVSASSRNTKGTSPAARPVATSAVAASPAAASPAATTEEQALLQANGGLVRAFERDDTATIERLLDPDFTWIDPTGIIRSKEEVLLALPPSATSNGVSATKNAAGAGAGAGASTSASV